jgi:hypothetical protein
MSAARMTNVEHIAGGSSDRFSHLDGFRMGLRQFISLLVAPASAAIQPYLKSARNLKKLPVFAWLAALGFCAPAFAQMDTATLSGRIVDASGTAIARARVELVDIERNTKTTTSTNNDGLYIFPDIKPGQYRVEVSAAGYKTVNLTNLTIYTQADFVAHVALAAGSPLESIILSASGTPTQMSGAVGTVVDQTLITNLPLNGRSFQTLFELTPGVVITAASPTSQGQFSVNGQRANANYFVIDGVSANFGLAAGVNPGQSAGGSLPALTAFGGTNSLVSTDDVQEFAVVTSSYSPEFGRVPGGQVSIVTRTGTNEIHGTFFDYLRNDALDANDWFANREGLGRAALRQNDFGLVLGGPIVKGKTFFFASYEGLRLRQPNSRVTDVPSLATRNSASSSIKPFLEAYPVPNGRDEGNGLSVATYSFSDPSTLDAASIRVDHHRSQSMNLFGRYVYSISDRQQRGAQANSLSTVTDTRFGLQTLTAGLTNFIAPQLTTALRFNWSASSAIGADRLDSFGRAISPLPRAVFPAAFSNKNGLFQFVPALGPANIGLALGEDNKSIEHQINILFHSSLQFRAHVVEAGIDLRSLSPEVAPPAYGQTIVFRDISSALASMMLFTDVRASVAAQSHFASDSLYFQDAWKPQARLSVNCGIRWEYNPAPNVQGSNGLKPFALNGINSLPTLSLGAPLDRLYRATLNNFGPRVGVAYELWRSPSFEAVIRAGAGTFFDLGSGPAGNAVGGIGFPFLARKFLVGVPFPLSPENAAPPSLLASTPVSAIQVFPSVLKLPYSYHWSLAVEQSLGREQVINVGFVGAVGHSLLRTEEFVGGEGGLPAAFTEVFVTNNSGFSNYNALQIQFRRRSRKNLDLIVSYTLAHSLDNVSSDSTFQGVPARFIDPRTNYGPSDFDIRHTASAGVYYRPRVAAKSPAFRALVSNWVLDAIILTRSAQPVDVMVVRDIGFGSYPLRPDLIIGAPRYVSGHTIPGGRRLNPDAFLLPKDDRQGDLGRNSLRGYPLFQADIAIGRRFRVTRHLDLSARAEAFNVFNHPNFGPPANQLGNFDSGGRFIPEVGFGLSQTTLSRSLQAGSFNTGFSSLYQIGGTRSIQLALKVEF